MGRPRKTPLEKLRTEYENLAAMRAKAEGRRDELDEELAIVDRWLDELVTEQEELAKRVDLLRKAAAAAGDANQVEEIEELLADIDEMA